MDNINVTNKNLNFSSEMKLGFAFIHTQNVQPYRNFLKKIEVDETNEKLILTFTKFAKTPIVVDFKNKIMTFATKKRKPFNKFILVTYEYVQDKKAVALKTFRFDKDKLSRGIKYFKKEDMKNARLTNFLDIHDDIYDKASRKLIENDLNYIYHIPDFYSCFLQAG
jgi:hypothetical protein